MWKCHFSLKKEYFSRRGCVNLNCCDLNKKEAFSTSIVARTRLVKNTNFAASFLDHLQEQRLRPD